MKSHYPIFLVLSFLTFSLLASSAACSSAPETTESSHADDHVHEQDEAENTVRIPNDGAVIRIVSPEEGATFPQDQDIVIEVEIENFEVEADGSHWHVYVNGESYGMVGITLNRHVVRGLTPGEYEVAAFLAFGTHEELEEPGRINLTVTE